jgi:hypothetical protein
LANRNVTQQKGAPNKSARREEALNVQRYALGGGMRPRTLSPAVATVLSRGFAPRTPDRAPHQMRVNRHRRGRAGRLVNPVPISDPDCSLAATMPQFTGEAT